MKRGLTFAFNIQLIFLGNQKLEFVFQLLTQIGGHIVRHQIYCGHETSEEWQQIESCSENEIQF